MLPAPLVCSDPPADQEKHNSILEEELQEAKEVHEELLIEIEELKAHINV